MFGLTPHDAIYLFSGVIAPAGVWAHRTITGYLKRIERNTDRMAADVKFHDVRLTRVEDVLHLPPLDRRVWLPGDDLKEATR